MIGRKTRSWAVRIAAVAALLLGSGNAFAASINQCSNAYNTFNQVAHAYWGEEIPEHWNVLGTQGAVTLGWLNSLDDLEGVREGRDAWREQASKPSEASNEDDLQFEQMSRTHLALILCLYDQRIAELEADASAMADAQDPAPEPVVEAEDAAGTCPVETAQAIDERLADIDARVQRFLETPLGKQQGSATPLLQVIMWATSAQGSAIKGQCPDNPAYRKRVQELDAAYASALKACRQVQSRPEVCGPSPPEDVLAANPFTEDDQRRMDEDEQARRDIDWSKLAPKGN